MNEKISVVFDGEVTIVDENRNALPVESYKSWEAIAADLKHLGKVAHAKYVLNHQKELDEERERATDMFCEEAQEIADQQKGWDDLFHRVPSQSEMEGAILD